MLTKLSSTTEEDTLRTAVWNAADSQHSVLNWHRQEKMKDKNYAALCTLSELQARPSNQYEREAKKHYQAPEANFWCQSSHQWSVHHELGALQCYIGATEADC